MSWISDVREEIRNLDVSMRSLRKFGLSVGAVLCFLAVWMVFKGYLPWARWIVGTLGLSLMLAGLVVPNELIRIYLVWMGVAFALGLVVSRVLLTIMFYLVITPTGFIANLFGKEFMDIKNSRSSETYWIRRESVKKTKYNKMY